MKITKESKVGLIVVIVIAASYWGFNYLKGRDIFQKTKDYYVEYKKIGGLRESNIVTINGYQVGIVRKIKFDIMNPSRLQAILAIDSKIRIPKGTVARIENIDLLGTVGVGLIMSESKNILADKDTLLGDNELSLNDQVAPLKSKLENMLTTLDSTMSIAKTALDHRTVSNLQKSLENINDFTFTLAEQRQKLGVLLDQLVSVSSSSNLSSVINNLAEVSDSLKSANLAVTIRNLNKTILETNKIMSQVSSGKGSLGKIVNNDSLYLGILKASRDLDSLILDINRNPHRYVQVSVFGNKKKK